jgi:large subunit ribosomal protein L30
MPDLVVTQVRSSIGAKPKHRGTLRALGLGRIGKSNTLPDRPEIRGMIAKVPHMITVDEAESSGAEKAPAKKAAAKKTGAKKAPAKKAPAKKATAKKATATSGKAVAKRTANRRGLESAEGGDAEGGASTEAKER